MMRGSVQVENEERSFNITVPSEELDQARKIYYWIESLPDVDLTYDSMNPNADESDGPQRIEMWSNVFLDIVNSIAQINFDDQMFAAAKAQCPTGDIIGTLSLLEWSIERAATKYGLHFAALHEHLKKYMTQPEARNPPYINNTKMVQLWLKHLQLIRPKPVASIARDLEGVEYSAQAVAVNSK